MKRKPKSERKRLVKALDTAFSLYVRKRDKNVCQICGSYKQPQCGHILSRVAHSTRWDLTNACCMCAKCNLLNEFQPQHVISWYIHNHGLKAWDDLCFRYNQPRKWQEDELRMLIDYYQAQLKVLP